MTRPRRNLRLFAALYPPAGLAAEMVAIAAALASERRLDGRATPAAQVHLTLQFVGDVPAAKLDDVVESVERSVAGLGGFTITPRRMMTLPRNRPARLIAMETDTHATLRELKDRLARRLARPARSKPGDRFVPHLTLMRFRSQVEIDPIEVPVDLPGFEVDAVHLMRSTLRPTGAEHHEIACFHLEPAS